MRQFLFKLLTTLSILLIAFWLFLVRPIVFSPEAYESEIKGDPQTLESHVRKLSEDFVPRDWTHPENMNACAAYISSFFKKYDALVTEQIFQEQGNTYRNIIASYEGSPGGDWTIIGAHYDTKGELPGADDNASGVAGLLELAKLLRKKPLKKNIQLVAYALEEPPFFRTSGMGSAHHARFLRKKNVSVRLMISLEMIGYFSEDADSQNYPAPILKLFYPSTAHFITVVGGPVLTSTTFDLKRSLLSIPGLDAHSINSPSFVPGIDYSDHLSYWNEGFEAVMITDTSFLRYRHYHQETDTADRLNYEKMSRVVEGVHRYLSGES